MLKVWFNIFLELNPSLLLSDATKGTKKIHLDCVSSWMTRRTAQLYKIHINWLELFSHDNKQEAWNKFNSEELFWKNLR
jgi:hypothetical protein